MAAVVGGVEGERGVAGHEEVALGDGDEGGQQAHQVVVHVAWRRAWGGGTGWRVRQTEREGGGGSGGRGQRGEENQQQQPRGAAATQQQQYSSSGTWVPQGCGGSRHHCGHQGVDLGTQVRLEERQKVMCWLRLGEQGW